MFAQVFSSRGAGGALLTAVILELTAATAYIHFSLGGTLFLLNAVGYVVLGLGYALGSVAPIQIVQRFGWLPRVALAAYAVVTIGAYLVTGLYIVLGWVARAAGAVDWRTTRIGPTITSSTRWLGSPRSIMSSSMSAAIRPISTPDWLIVVSGGIVNDAMSMSSKPTIESWSGTTILAWNAACRRPIAIVSDAAKTAVGRLGRSKCPNSSRPSR